MVLKVKDVNRIKEKMVVGAPFIFETSVWTDALKTEKVRYNGKIKGVYPFGMEITFNHNGREQTKWMSYVDVCLAKANGCVPYITTCKTIRPCDVAIDEDGWPLF